MVFKTNIFVGQFISIHINCYTLNIIKNKVVDGLNPIEAGVGGVGVTPIFFSFFFKLGLTKTAHRISAAYVG